MPVIQHLDTSYIRSVMEVIRDILVNLFSDAIWALGGFLVARFVFSKRSFWRKVMAAKENSLDKKELQESADVDSLSIFDYQISRRMFEACNLLLETDKSLKEIARLVGFKSIFSFSAAFKSYFGEPPIVVRNRNNQSSLGEYKNCVV